MLAGARDQIEYRANCMPGRGGNLALITEASEPRLVIDLCTSREPLIRVTRLNLLLPATAVWCTMAAVVWALARFSHTNCV